MIKKILSWVSFAVSFIIMFTFSYGAIKHGGVQWHNVIGLLEQVGLVALSVLFPVIAVILNIRKSNRILTTVATVISLLSSLYLLWGVYAFVTQEFCGNCGGSNITVPQLDLDTPIIETISSPLIITDKWKTFTDKVLGVEFKYPPQFVTDVDSTDNLVHLVNKSECKHSSTAAIRNTKFCYCITVSNTPSPNNSPKFETIGANKIPGYTYEEWSSGGTFTHTTSVSTYRGYVFGYSFNNNDQTEKGTLQDVKDNYYAILSTVNFIK